VADGFETDRQTNFRLKRDDALVLSDAIRRRKVIPRLIPQGARERHDFDGWRKSWWYVPAAMVGCRYVTPLILHQSGIWGFKELGGDLRLLVDFEQYTSLSTTLRAPESLLAAVRAKDGNPPEPSAQDAEWIEMSFGTAAAGVDAFKVVFNEVLGTEQLGFHLLIVDAMLEVWWPTVAEFRGKEFFVIPDGMFLDFDSYADVIAWAAADDAALADLTVVPDTEESDETVETAEQESTDTETPVEPISLLEQPAFKTLILRTKRIARHSKAATLTPLLVLCAAVADALEDEAGKLVPFSKGTSAKIHAAAAAQGIMFPSAQPSRGATKDDLMPLSDDLKVILKQYRTSTLRDFLKALIAALD
jgi:hypothetical protein